MKLYVFDSCPYCARVRAFIGLKGIECDVIHMVYGERPKFLGSALEHFTVPVLEMQERKSGDPSVIAESLDIIRKLDEIESPVFDNYLISDVLEKRLAQLKPISAQLLYPRMPKLNLPELATSCALDAFITSRNKVLGQTINQALKKTDQYLLKLNEQLILLAQELDVDAYLTGRRNVNINDIAAFSELRSYSMIAELIFSEKMQLYVDALSSRTKVEVYAPISGSE